MEEMMFNLHRFPKIHPGINLTMEMNDLQNEKCEIPMKEIKGTNK
jgi:hypothetical protein